ncbi:MAG: molybdopterin-dependent oxidoreductase, partial [Actinomycetia bacterium]|nr:molybdopterin-dependent oxidoreductase [Actinomycetes bacterium]
QVRLHGADTTRVTGNNAHLDSQGYTCEKALRINHYQHAKSRLTSPLRRRDDGSSAATAWDTAIREVAAKMTAIGGDNILYYGGGGQGNHLCGAYGAATRRAFGITRRSNAMAQEKTGEAWVDGRMIGHHTSPDFHHSEVALFVGKNPWHSHGIPEARRTIKALSSDPDRALIVIDPKRSETAALADYFLQVVPGTDAFCIAAILGVLAQEDLTAADWLADNTVGSEAVLSALTQVPVADYARRCGVDEDLIRRTANRMAEAASMAVLEDLGVEMAPSSTLVSYLQKLLWALTGNFAKPGGVNTHSSLVPLFSYGASGSEPRDPVTNSQIISGLLVCNEIAEGVLSNHPERVRAMFIESANPVHSLAESPAFRQAMRALEFSVVIDVAMTETAREADYVLPASSQYEKVEATFFNMEFPDNVFYLRRPLLEPLGDTLSEPEIHTRLIRQAGVYDEADIAPLLAAAKQSRVGFAAAMAEASAAKPELAGVGAAVLYEALGPTLPEGMAGAAPLWFSAQQCAMRYGAAVRAAGIDGDDATLGDALFDAFLDGDDGVLFTRHDYDQAWEMVKPPDQKLHLDIPELLAELAELPSRPTTYASDDYPFILAAGERRSFTANTVVRDPAWRKKDAEGALQMNPLDATELGIDTGSRVRVVTRGGAAEAVVETTESLQRRHITLPNGMGLDYPGDDNEAKATGVSPNELTTLDWRDAIAGTPWHKHVPARVEPIPA